MALRMNAIWNHFSLYIDYCTFDPVHHETAHGLSDKRHIGLDRAHKHCPAVIKPKIGQPWGGENLPIPGENWSGVVWPNVFH